MFGVYTHTFDESEWIEIDSYEAYDKYGIIDVKPGTMVHIKETDGTLQVVSFSAEMNRWYYGAYDTVDEWTHDVESWGDDWKQVASDGETQLSCMLYQTVAALYGRLSFCMGTQSCRNKTMPQIGLEWLVRIIAA